MVCVVLCYVAWYVVCCGCAEECVVWYSVRCGVVFCVSWCGMWCGVVLLWCGIV